MQDQDRRSVLRAVGAIGGLGVVPAVSSADTSTEEFQVESLEREELVSADSYAVYRYRVNEEVIYLKQLDEEKGMKTLRPADVSEAERQDVSKLVQSEGWTDKVTKYKIETGTQLERCSAIDGYGQHWWGTATVEFSVPLKTLELGTIATVVNELFRELGLPEVGDIVGPIVSFIGTKLTPDATIGAEDTDLPFSTPGIQSKYGLGWDKDISELTGGPTAPGLHRR
ncbi:hypothetical protein [Halobaculum sp. MBLA0143]|uniref:hypothetical protein n=1 Tax=Halobaculum sp. MBLA0143 TaxID=3079933 RepID=UPI003524861D